MIKLICFEDRMMGNTNLKKINLLAVDDEAQIIEHLQKHLAPLCASFKAFTTPTDALYYFKENKIDIVVCDIRMPLLNGIELCKRFKEIHPNIIIVMLSASNDTNYLVEAINLGINQFLMKPYRMKNLIQTLERFAAQIVSVKEVTIYNEVMHNEFDIESQDFDDIIHALKQYKKAINKTNLVRKISPDGFITNVNKKFRKTKNITSDVLVDNKLANFDNILEEVSKKGSYKALNIFEDEDKSYLRSTYLPILNRHKELEEILEISQNVSEIYHLNEEVYKTQEAIIYMLSTVIENRSKETASHVQRVAHYSEVLAKNYGLSQDEINLLKMVSPLHDIGKIAIPDDILMKPDSLSDEEFMIIKEHTVTGYNILKDSKNHTLSMAGVIAHEHHENWDGTGYPRNLKGEAIHIFSRITALADVFDALIHDRVYKKAWSIEKVTQFIQEQSGKKFEPKLVEIFITHLDEFIAISNRYNEQD